MMIALDKLNHGRETYAIYYGDRFVLKRPLPTFSEEQKQAWLVKQHKTKETIDAVRSINHTAYNIPKMEFINDDEYQILEERAPGTKLTRELFRSLSTRQRYEIINSLGTFLVDMNELRPAIPEPNHKITSEFRFDVLSHFVNNRMGEWFKKNEVLQMKRFCERLDSFTYDTYRAWSHGDLNSGNVYYDEKTSTLSFIDFAEADYHLIYADIFAPLQTDLRKNPQSEKGVRNTAEKIAFMREQMAAILALEQKYTKKR